MNNPVQQRTISFWNQDNDDAFARVDEAHRMAAAREKILFALKAVYPRPVRWGEIRSHVGLRTATFWLVLQDLVKEGSVMKLGRGRKKEPHKYVLGKERQTRGSQP